MPLPVAISSGSLEQVAKSMTQDSTIRQVIRLSRPEQLFQADPVLPTSQAYTEFTAQPAMDTVRDLIIRRAGKASRIELVVELPADQIYDGIDEELTTAVRRWVTVQNAIDDDSASAGGAVGRRLFVFGLLAFLILQIASIYIRYYGDDWNNYPVQAIAEGVSVTSWVMLWFPVQLFTVESWRSAIRRRRARLIEQLHVLVTAH